MQSGVWLLVLVSAQLLCIDVVRPNQLHFTYRTSQIQLGGSM